MHREKVIHQLAHLCINQLSHCWYETPDMPNKSFGSWFQKVRSMVAWLHYVERCDRAKLFHSDQEKQGKNISKRYSLKDTPQ